jgi:hypothetical protein
MHAFQTSFSFFLIAIDETIQEEYFLHEYFNQPKLSFLLSLELNLTYNTQALPAYWFVNRL